MNDPYAWRTVAEERAAVVAEAKTWLRTPYHHHARVKGAGVDCAQLPAAVYEACGLIPHIEPRYTPDWHIHRNEEKYLGWLQDLAREIAVEDRQAGDFMVWRWGRTFSHGAIVVDLRTVVHAWAGENVRYEDPTTQVDMRRRASRCFTFWG